MIKENTFFTKNLTTLLMSVLFINTFIYSQTTIWEENFNLPSDNGLQNKTGEWKTYLDGTSNVFEVVSNRFEAKNTGGREQTFETENISISDFSNVSLSLDLTQVGDMDYNGGNRDYIRVYYSLDGGAEIPFNNGINNGDLSSQDVTPYVIGLSGSTIKIIIRVQNNNDNETYYFDNLLIQGTRPLGPEINIQGGSPSVTITDGDSSPSIADFTDFGVVNVGSTVSKTFTIENLGTQTLDLTGSPFVICTGAGFSITSQPGSSISSGSSTTFTISFTPTSISTTNGNISIASNDSNENPYNFSISGSAEKIFFDSDGDGVSDDIDIDDDNDGIKDVDEESACRLTSIAKKANYKFLNETFGTGGRTTITGGGYPAQTNYTYEPGPGDLDDGDYTVGSSAQIASWADEYWYKGGDHTPGDTNGRMALFNAETEPSEQFYSATIKGALPNIPITYSFWVINLDRTDAPSISTRNRPKIRVEFTDASNNLLKTINTVDTQVIEPTLAGDLNGTWFQFTEDLVLNVDEFFVTFYNDETGGSGNDLAIDDIVISQTLCDSDGDGVANIYDLDSDNDGIPDVVEAGLGNMSNGTANISFTSGWIDSNGNGMHDSAESNAVLDSDGDGIPNYMDLDSDNDGLFDVDESGAGNTADPSFQNGDGDINGDGIGDGLDTDEVREADIDSDGILEFFPDGILDVYDYFEGGVFSTSYGNINQGLTGAGWVDYVIDTDLDGIPDYIDVMSNGSTFDIAATLYASLDSTLPIDGIIDSTTDTDGDGILDPFDTDNTEFGSPRDLSGRKLNLYFDGRNDYVEDSNVINGWTDASIMVWVKIDPTATGEQIIVGQNEFFIQLNPDKSITAYANGKTITNGSPIALNQWVHLSITHSGTAFKLYINGLELATDTGGTLPSDTSSFTIGRKPDTPSNYYHGFIDEVKVFDKALGEDELRKMIYQEVENNSGIVMGSVIPRNVTDYINSSTNTPLNWASLKRYFRMDVYKDDVIDDLTTGTVDSGIGAKIYNMKIIEVQTAPLPFITQQSGSLPTSVNCAIKGWSGNDVITYDWSIVKVEHNNVNFNGYQKHLGLFVNKLDAVSNPIEFSILNNSELNVSWYLRLDGFIDLEDESQLVQGDDSNLDEDSEGYIERDQQGTANSYNYNYWSSSVGPIGTGVGSNNASFKLVDVLKDGTDPSNPNTISFLPAHTAADSGVSSPIKISSYWLYTFNGGNDDYYAWKSINENSLIITGEGYTMKGTSGSIAIGSNQNYVFKGKPNNGDFTLPIVAGNDRLIGNPYPSAMDADEFIKDNIKETINGKVGRNTNGNIFNGALYFWDHFGEANSHNLGAYVGGYATYTLMGGAKAYANDERINNTGAVGNKRPGRYIPVNQGFFVIAVNDTLTGSTPDPIILNYGGDIVFKNSQRVFKKEIEVDGLGTPISVFMKGPKSKKGVAETDSIINDVRPKFWLQLNSPNGYHRQLLIGVDKNATNNFDLGYDAQIADIGAEDMYWIVDGSKFVIQAVNNFDDNQELPIGLKISEEGRVSIKIETLENIDATVQIFLKDNLTGIEHQINDKAFEINLPAGEYNNRFSVTFKTIKIVEDEVAEEIIAEVIEEVIEETTIKGVQVFMNNKHSELTIRKDSETNIESVELYNYLGQIMARWNNDFTGNEISLPVNVVAGVYLVQIITTTGKTSKKIIID
jgi:hypothetical protein